MSTGGSKRISSTVQEFYDSLAPRYDLMTGFDQRFVREVPFFRLLVDRYDIKRALDAGCGSGFHSILLSQLGVQMTAVDVSEKMIQLTVENARRLSVRVRTVKSSFQDLSSALKDRFDAVFVMGNSLPHLLSRSELKKALQSFSDVLGGEGILFSQNLNYARILSEKENIQSTKKAGETTFIRSYDYDEKGIVFTIEAIHEAKDEVHEVQSVRLRPVLEEEVVPLLMEVGFKETKIFGGISMEPYDPATSKDLVILAKK